MYTRTGLRHQRTRRLRRGGGGRAGRLEHKLYTRSPYIIV